MKKIIRCWCGNTKLIPFSDGYLKCSACETLVAEAKPEQNLSNVSGDAKHFYGRDYWSHLQEKKLGYPSIQDRARRDLSERCLHWLSTILKYKLPPANILELGSAHGGFVALLRWAGFDAIGLELNPWVVDYARSTFGVPMLLGPVEDQSLETESFDIIVMMDVLEHFTNPVETINYCLSLLKENGTFIVQTPRFQENIFYEELVAKGDQFLDQLSKDKGHLYLFSERSIKDFFLRLGCKHVQFEPAIFAHYDMFIVVSRTPPEAYTYEDIANALQATSNGRLVLAILDLQETSQANQASLQKHCESIVADSAARLEVIEEQGRRLGEVEAERNNLQAELGELRRHFESVEADSAARLEVIEEQGRRLGEVEAERNNLQSELGELRQRFSELETERDKLQSERDGALQVLFSVSKSRAYKLLRRLGRWKAIEQLISEISEGSIPPAG